MGGYVPLSWPDIRAWAEVTKTELDSDDALMLRHLSKMYVSSLNQAKDPSCPAPHVDKSKVDNDVLKEQLLAWANSFPKDHFKK